MSSQISLNKGVYQENPFYVFHRNTRPEYPDRPDYPRPEYLNIPVS